MCNNKVLRKIRKTLAVKFIHRGKKHIINIFNIIIINLKFHHIKIVQDKTTVYGLNGHTNTFLSFKNG